MRLLAFEWAAGTYTFSDVSQTFEKMGIQFHTVSYAFSDVNEDEFFEWRFGKCLEEDKYDAVYSTNYFPLVAKCCNRYHIKYISWSYDNPLDVPRIEETLGFEENYLFLFDRIQVQKYERAGFNNVYHMPLAVNTDRLDGIKLTSAEINRYTSDISFVGKLYESPISAYYSVFDDYTKGYIDSIIKAQGKIYGYYMIDDLLTDDFISNINRHIKSLNSETKFRMSKEALAYAMAAQVTREERLMLLKILGTYHGLKLYSREDNEYLKGCVQYMGSCGYLKEMPKVFKSSKINLNITLKISQSGVPLRVMDILGSGGFLLSNYQPEIAEYFENFKDVVLYDSIEDAFEKADYYLKHEDERIQIAKNGYENVKNNFSYNKQFAKIFSIVFDS